MAKPPKRSNPIKLRAGMKIGSISAETDDEFLFDCFTYHPAVETCTNMKSPGMVISGRTGAGKTAIIRHIEHISEHSASIDPSEMSLSYVSNSDALRFLQAIGADLDLLFQSLWKHVLCIEFIRLRYKVCDEIKSMSVFHRFFERFRTDARKERSLRYLREWEGRFWITMDQNIREITEKYETRLHAELGSDIEKFKTRGQYDKQLSSEKKSELVSRAKKIINSDQLVELAGVIDMLAEQDIGDSMNRYFIMVDRLDERWVDENIRFRLIRSLIEALKSFRKIHNLKILVAMRSDILERVVQETGDLTFQREKFEEYFIKLKWTTKELKDLVRKRVRLLFRKQYAPQNDVDFEDLFSYKVGSSDPFDYMLERTLMRPRDIISFINECLLRAEGLSEITAKTIRNAEAEFSRIRRQALESEWRSAFPTLPLLLDFISAQKKALLTFMEISQKDAVEELALKIGGQEKIDYDPLYTMAANAFSDGGNFIFVREIIATLYRVGSIGIKLHPSERFLYSHLDQPVILPTLLTEDVKVRIHPMLHRSLNIQP